MIDRAEWADFMEDWLEQRRERFDRWFNAADDNGDGFISRAEAQRNEPLLAERFDSIDTDGDGQLSPREIRRAMRQQQREMGMR